MKALGEVSAPQTWEQGPSPQARAEPSPGTPVSQPGLSDPDEPHSKALNHKGPLIPALTSLLTRVHSLIHLTVMESHKELCVTLRLDTQYQRMGFPSTPPSSLPTPGRYPITQLNSDAIYLAIASVAPG